MSRKQKLGTFELTQEHYREIDGDRIGGRGFGVPTQYRKVGETKWKVEVRVNESNGIKPASGTIRITGSSFGRKHVARLTWFWDSKDNVVHIEGETSWHFTLLKQLQAKMTEYYETHLVQSIVT